MNDPFETYKRHDVSKLPRWAQTMIRNLEDDNARMRTTIDAVTTENTRVFTDPYDDNPVPVADERETVRFYLTERTDTLSRQWCDIEAVDGELVVMAGHTLAVEPRSSNHLRMRVKDR